MRIDLDESPGWRAYEAELRPALKSIIDASGSEMLEIGDLLVAQPLPSGFSDLRNGLQIQSDMAVDLIVMMAAGRGPYCSLIGAGQFRIQSGWDGAVHLYVPIRVADASREVGSKDLRLDMRPAVSDRPASTAVVDTVADEGFWTNVQASTDRMVLLCERWAHGAYGCRWFRVTSHNTAVLAKTVRPRSLLSVIVDPDLALDQETLEDDFTAFKGTLEAGELTYRAFPGGTDDSDALTSVGFHQALRDSTPANWRAVVPDPDGILRGQWEAPL